MSRLVSLIVCVLVSGAAYAERPLLSGSLGLWLDRTVAPEFVDKLAHHPKFKNTTLNFVTLENGQPVSENGLTKAIQKDLIHHVLKAGTNNVSWRHGVAGCAALPKAEYVVGVEVVRRGATQYRLHLAVLDPEERIWVSGLSFSWEGRLLTSEKRALARSVASDALGTLANPVAISDNTSLIRIVRDQFKCTLRSGLDGPVYVSLGTAQSVQKFVGEMRRIFAVRSGIVLTDDESAAAWRVDTQIRSVSDRVFELAVNVKPIDSGGQVQRVASLFVAGVEATRGDPAGLARSEVARSEPVLARLDLVSAEPDPACGKPARARGTDAGKCAEVVLELNAQAHIFVFATSGGNVNVPRCSGQLREAGEYRYRVKIENTQPVDRRPVAGFYVVASRDRSAISRISSRVGRLGGTCSGGRSTLEQVTEAITQNDGAIEWKTIHLRLERDSLVTI